MAVKDSAGVGLIAVGMMLGMTGAAHGRGTISGWATPQYGGAFAGAGEPGVQGIPYNPAASVSEHLEMSINVTGLMSDYSAQLEGKKAEVDAKFQGVPFVAVVVPVPRLDRVGMGFSMGVPYGRTAGDLAANSPQRFHALDGHVISYEFDTSIGVEPIDGIVLGGGLAYSWVTVGTKYAFNTGAVLTRFIGPEMEPLIDDPLMEGLVETQDGQGQGFGGTAGVRITAVEGWTMAGVYRTQTAVPFEAFLNLIPSNSFQLALESDVTGELVFPAEAHFMVAREMRGVRLAMEGQWVGWSAVANLQYDLVNPTLGSPDPVMELILSEYGLTDLSVLGQSQADRRQGFVDTFGGGLRADIDAGAWMVMLRSFYASRAVPDAWVHPGSLDFSSMDNRVGIRRRFKSGLDLGLSFGWYIVPDRNVRDSTASYLSDPDKGHILPSGNGDYHLNLWSTGLSVVFRLP